MSNKNKNQLHPHKRAKRSMEVVDSAVDDADGSRPRKVMDALHRIASSVKSMEKNDADCILCTEVINILTFEDVIKFYSCILACVTNHVSDVGPVEYSDMFIVEGFVLDQICKAELLDFDRIFEGTECSQDKRKERVLEIAERYFPNSSININCEQELESLMYKLYAGYSSDMREALTPKDIEMLLIVLLKRLESTRFFKVFNQHARTEGIFRLGLLMALKDDNTVLMDKLLRDMNGYKFSTESLFLGCEDDLIAQITEPMNLMSIDNVKEWVESKKSEIEWEECVHFWSTNRAESSGALNKSMMDLCIKYGKYEEGWIVYRRGCKKTTYVVHKACILALRALRETGNEEWISRVFEIVEESLGRGEEDVRYLITNDVLENLSSLPEDTGNLVLKEFIGQVYMANENEEIVSLVIRGLFRLCRECENSQTYNLCGDYADKLYNKWRKHRLYGEHSIEDHGKIESEIYSNILGVFDALKDKHKFFNVCRDLANSNTKMTKELCSRLQKLHIADRISSESDAASLEQHGTWERLISLIMQKH